MNHNHESHNNHNGHNGHKEHNGHQRHHEKMVVDFHRRFWISMILTVPVIVLAPMIQELLGVREILKFKGDLYILWGLSTAIFIYGGRPFFKGLFDELSKKRPGMMTLLSALLIWRISFGQNPGKPLTGSKPWISGP